MTENKRTIGGEYEKLASEYLHNLGYQILTLNFRTRTGEIDIIAMDNNTLVFIEVKYRSSTKYGYPEEAVDYRKQIKIRKTAMYFMSNKKYSINTPVRFDVIAILGKKITHIKDAF